MFIKRRSLCDLLICTVCSRCIVCVTKPSNTFTVLFYIHYTSDRAAGQVRVSVLWTVAHSESTLIIINHRVIKSSHILVKVSVSCCSEAVYLTEKLLTDVKLVWFLTDVYIYYFIYYIILFILNVLYVTVYTAI